MHVNESKCDVLHGFSEGIIWDLADRREEMLPCLKIDEICFEAAAAILAALSELTGTHFC